MDLANATGCHLTADSQVPISFSGVAYVTTSPVEGKKRLQWVAPTTSDGRGLSFRADRWAESLKFPLFVSNLKRSFRNSLRESK